MHCATSGHGSAAKSLRFRIRCRASAERDLGQHRVPPALGCLQQTSRHRRLSGWNCSAADPLWVSCSLGTKLTPRGLSSAQNASQVTAAPPQRPDPRARSGRGLQHPGLTSKMARTTHCTTRNVHEWRLGRSASQSNARGYTNRGGSTDADSCGKMRHLASSIEASWPGRGLEPMIWSFEGPLQQSA